MNEKILNNPIKSSRKFKKFQVYVKDSSGKIKSIHFGDTRYEDFTQHKDIQRKRLFRLRHGCDPVSKLNKSTPRYWSCQYLWK